MWIKFVLFKVDCKQNYTLTTDNVMHLAMMKAPRLWFTYVRALLYKSLDKLHNEPHQWKPETLLKIAKSKKHFIMFSSQINVGLTWKLFIKSINTSISDDYSEYTRKIFHIKFNLSKPIGSIDKEGKSRELFDKYFYIEHYQWQFKLDTKLRLNITLRHLKFAYYHNYKCFVGSVHISSHFNWSIEYCGVLSNITSYPPDFKGTISMSIHSYVSFNLKIQYSVTDENVITSLAHNEFINYTQLLCWKYKLSHINSDQQYFGKYGIFVDKYQIMRINFVPTPSPFANVEVFDGPGYSSDRYVPPHVDFSETMVFYTNTFQAVVYKFGQQGKLVYSAQIIQPKKIRPKMGFNILFPDTILCSSNADLCSLMITTNNKSSNIRVTVLGISYSGTEDNTLCNFAGLSAYNIMDDGSYKHISTVCDPHNDFYQYRPIYSNSSTLLLVMYWYKIFIEIFNISFAILETHCSSVKINLCISKFHVFQNTALLMNIKQEASGFIQKIEFISRHLYIYFTVVPNKCAIFQFFGNMGHIDK